MPKPVSLLVGNTMGWAPTCLRATASAIATAPADGGGGGGKKGGKAKKR